MRIKGPKTISETVSLKITAPRPVFDVEATQPQDVDAIEIVKQGLSSQNIAGILESTFSSQAGDGAGSGNIPDALATQPFPLIESRELQLASRSVA